MSILIKGMEMPKSNTMFTVTLRVRQDGTAEFISTSRKTVKSFPMIEVPTPHGRLIDENELLRHKYGFSQTARVIIKTTDAVIEAEVSEG